MDPNANLKEQAEIVALPKKHNYDRYRLYDLRVALKDWLKGGGFAPTWHTYPDAADKFKQWLSAYTPSRK